MGWSVKRERRGISTRGAGYLQVLVSNLCDGIEVGTKGLLDDIIEVTVHPLISCETSSSVGPHVEPIRQTSLGSVCFSITQT